MRITNKNRMISIVVPLLFVFLWSTGFIAAKYTVHYAPPFKLLFLRGLLSCFIFFSMMRIARVRIPSLPAALEQIKIGLFLHALFLGGCFFAINHGMSPALVALITGLQPILTAMLLAIREKQSMALRKWLGIVVGFIGVCLVLLPGKTNISVALAPLVSSVMALFGVTVGSLYQKRVRHPAHILAATFCQYISLTLVMGLISLLVESTPVEWSLSFVGGLLWLVVGISVTAILLYIYMIKMGEATKVATYFYLVPVVTALQAWIVFGDTISAGMACGMIITIIGMVVILV